VLRRSAASLRPLLGLLVLPVLPLTCNTLGPAYSLDAKVRPHKPGTTCPNNSSILTPPAPPPLPPPTCPQEHLRGEALKTNELLRHFWGCMPLLSGVRADKAASLAAHLEEQRALLASHMRHHSGEGAVVQGVFVCVCSVAVWCGRGRCVQQVLQGVRGPQVL
jgi:hypothetical protein